MQIIEAFKAEFEHEAALTRKTLARVPEDKLGWRPHEKSFTLGGLAAHLAEIYGWLEGTLNQPEWDISGYKAPEIGTQAALLKMYDDSTSAGRRALEGSLTNEQMMENWRLLHNGQTIIEMPRAAVVRSFIFSHVVHHRAQLTVYLRLLDVPVPSIYGPSADEQ